MLKFLSFILSIFFDRFGSLAGALSARFSQWDSITGYGGSQMGLLMCVHDPNESNRPDAVPFSDDSVYLTENQETPVRMRNRLLFY